MALQRHSIRTDVSVSWPSNCRSRQPSAPKPAPEVGKPQHMSYAVSTAPEMLLMSSGDTCHDVGK